jgi:two-component system sensor histidine kinase BaeS
MIIIPRLTVFDAEKQWVVGQKMDWSQLTLYPIKLNQQVNQIEFDDQDFHDKNPMENTIGWLGVQPMSTFFGPKNIEFIRQQTNGIYISSIGVFLLSLIVAWWLSRHFVKPLQQLTAGTESLAARHFATRVTIKSQDELGRLANNFNQMAQTLEQYEQQRQQWLADIAHELRTPLAILRGEIEALQDGVHEINAETLESLHVEVLLLTRLVEDLRTLSLADSHALILRHQPLNPIEILQQTIDQFETRFTQANIHIKTHLPIKEDFSLVGDSDRLQQVFANLFENALRYVNIPGWLTINATLTATHLQIDFIDSGPGVPHFALPHLFERLYRVDRSRNRGKGGSGLGLAICKSIVEAHGGTIIAAHAPERGLWIKIQLPLNFK